MFSERPPYYAKGRNPFARNEYESIWQLPITWMLVVAIGTIATILLVHQMGIRGGFEVTKTFLLVQAGIGAAIAISYVAADGLSRIMNFDRTTNHTAQRLGQFAKQRLELEESREFVNQQVNTFLTRIQGEMTPVRKESAAASRKVVDTPVRQPVAPSLTSAPSPQVERERESETLVDKPISVRDVSPVVSAPSARVRDVQTPSGTVISMPTKPQLQVVDGFEEELADAVNRSRKGDSTDNIADDTRSDDSQIQRRSPRALRVHRAA